MASTAVATAALAGVAALVGVPIGLVVNAIFQRGIGEAIGYGPELATAPDVALLIIAIGAVVLTAVVIGTLTCVRSARRSASELIRYE